MTLLSAYRLGLLGSLGIGLGSVLLSQEVPTIFYLSVVILVLYGARYNRRPIISPTLGTILAIGTLITGVLLTFRFGLDFLVVIAASTLIAITIVRLLTSHSLRHEIQALLLSLLLLFAGAVLNTRISYGVLFILYSISAVWALIARQLIVAAEQYSVVSKSTLGSMLAHDRRIISKTFLAVSGAIALLLLASTLILFVSFPRIGLGSLGFAKKKNGLLPPSVTLDGQSRANTNQDVVARVYGLQYAHYDQGLYLRGPVYDIATSDGFVQAPNAVTPRLPSLTRLADGAKRLTYEIFMQPVTENILLTLGATNKAEIIAGGNANPSLKVSHLEFGPHGELMTPRLLTSAIRFRVDGFLQPHQRAGGEDLTDPDQLQPWLDLPSDLDPKISELEKSLRTPLQTRSEHVATLRSYLQTQMTYAVTPPQAHGSNPLSEFLFEHHQGHCEYFATAFAMLLRVAKIPSRVVGGYHGGLWDEESSVAVFRAADAHAWVEWYQPGRGWITDDATPPSTDETFVRGFFAWREKLNRAWDNYVLDYGLGDQLALARTFADSLSALPKLPHIQITGGRFFFALCGTGVVSVFIWYLSRRYRRHTLEEHLCLVLKDVAEKLAQRPIASHETIRAAIVAAIPLEANPHRNTLEHALKLYEALRFSRNKIPRPVIHQTLRNLLGIKRRLSDFKRGVG